MSERLLIAAIFIAVIIALGTAVRALGSTRARRKAAAVTVDSTAAGLAHVLVFSSRWCSECLAQHDEIERARASWPPTIEISYHDAVTESELAHQLGILLVPAIAIANAAGRIVEVKQGFVDADRLRSLLDTAA